MKSVAYLLGTYQEKREIHRTMESSPSFIRHDYISLCIDLLEHLYIAEVKNKKQVEWVIEDFIELMEEDITEQLRGEHRIDSQLRPYLDRVDRVLQFFKSYLDTIGWIPLPYNVHVFGCRSNSVMILSVE